MLTAVSLVATLAFIAVGLLVGIRLLSLAARTRGLPEATLGLGMLLIVGVGYPIALAGMALGAADGSALVADALVSGARILMGIGWSCVWIFTWRVFRPDAAWARGAAGAGIALQLLCATVSAVQTWAVDAPGALTPTPWSNGTQVLALAIYGWTFVEALHYHRRMRRRLLLGLADAAVANRFLLFALVAVFSFLSLVVPTAYNLAGTDVSASSWVRLSSVLSGLPCAATLYLAFLPPPRYAAWVRRRAAAADGRHGAPLPPASA